MCDIINLVESVKKLEGRYQIIKDEIVKTEQKVVHLYHVLEFGNLDAIGMVKLTKDLKQTLIKRRDLKNQKVMVQALTDLLPDSQKVMNKITTKNTDIKLALERYKSNTKSLTTRFQTQELMK